MKFSRLAVLAATLGLGAAAAQARNDPSPPPSGVVIHLFGPNSIASHIVPGLPGETAGPAAPPPGASSTGGITAAAAAPADAGPGMGAVLHQMFVVGDPDHPNKPAAGRSAERPGAGG